MSNMITANEFLTIGSGVLTLCGSTRFFFEAMEADRQLTFKNWMVLSCGSWGHSFHKYAAPDDNHDYKMVKRLHFQKILYSQAIVVVYDESEYIAESTKAEIAYARFLRRPVFFFDGEQFTGFTSVRPMKGLEYSNSIDAFEKQYGGIGDNLSWRICQVFDRFSPPSD